MDLVSLDEAKDFLNIRNDDNDDELESVIAAITRLVEREVGPINERTVTSVVQHSDGRAALPFKNIMSVQSITGVMSGGAIDLTGISTDKSILRYTNRSYFPYGELTVVYTVGLDEIPENIRYGALETLKLAWAAQLKGDLPAFLLSYRASAWFLPDQVMPGFS